MAAIKPAHTGRDVHHRATGKINRAFRAKVEQESVCRPHPVAKRVVNKDAPQGNEEAIGFERNPFGKRAGDECGRDDGKLGLEHGEYIFRNAGGHYFVVDAAEKEIVRRSTQTSLPIRWGRRPCYTHRLPTAPS